MKRRKANKVVWPPRRRRIGRPQVGRHFAAISFVLLLMLLLLLLLFFYFRLRRGPPTSRHVDRRR